MDVESGSGPFPCRRTVLIVNVKYAIIAVKEDHTVRTALASLATLATLFVLLTGCATNNVSPGPQQGPGYDLRTTPENVLENIELAYEEMDPEGYLDTMSEDFIFYPSDRDVQDPDMQIPPEWYKTDETTMHENMFDESSDVVSVSLTLTTITATFDEGNPGDSSDDLWIYEMAVDLRVNVMGGLTYLATTPSEFHMRVDQDQTGPGGMALWEVFKWYDLDERGPEGDGSRYEDSSWGGIKSLYR